MFGNWVNILALYFSCGGAASRRPGEGLTRCSGWDEGGGSGQSEATVLVWYLSFHFCHIYMTCISAHMACWVGSWKNPCKKKLERIHDSVVSLLSAVLSLLHYPSSMKIGKKKRLLLLEANVSCCWKRARSYYLEYGIRVWWTHCANTLKISST